MLQRLRSTLESDSGSLLIDAMVGVILTAVALIGVAFAVGASSTATAVNSGDTARQIWLQSYLSDHGTDPLAVPTTATTSTQTINSGSAPVTVWRQDVDAQSTTLYAATPRTGSKTQTGCADPSKTAANSCLTAQLSVPLDATGITTTNLTPAWTNAAVATGTGATVPGSNTTPYTIGAFTAPAGAAEVRYVFAVANATSAGQILFTDGAGRLLQTVNFDTTTDQYFYGSLPLYGNSTVTISTGATATISHFYVYGAPR